MCKEYTAKSVDADMACQPAGGLRWRAGRCRPVVPAVALVLLVSLGCQTATLRRSRPSSQANRTAPVSMVVEPKQIAAEDAVPANEMLLAEPNTVIPDTSIDQTLQEPPGIETMPAEDDVTAIYRDLGAKLRPDEHGQIVEIDFSFSAVTDSQLELLTVFPAIAELDLTGTEFSDAAASAILNLKSVRALKLKGTRITSSGLMELSQVSGLLLLDVSNTRVSDDGMAALSALTDLRYLSLNNTAITDAGLRPLKALRSLRGLSLINTSVTETGVAILKKALPDCLIVATADGGDLKSDVDPTRRLPDLNAAVVASAGLSSQQQLHQVIHLASLQPHLAVHLSRVYSSRGEWAEATQVLQAAELADSCHPALAFALGEALARSGRSAEAIPYFEKCASPAQARYLVGVIVYESSLQACGKFFDDVAAADPNLNAALIRRDRIQVELDALRSRPVTSSTADLALPEIMPGPPVRTVSKTRTSAVD
jgi:tetratricopeptide (TPR) repeat protein